MKILSIGDIHGRDLWKFYTHGSSYEYNHWRTSVEAGADPTDYEFWKEYTYAQVDKIIFVGDYCDSFDKTGEQILENLKEIILFKKALGDKVVLLLGNHDIQYMVPNEICSGYRGEMKFDLEQLFKENIDLFKIAHEEVGEDGSKWLWTHAGVTSGWYEKDLLRAFESDRFKYKAISDEFLKEERSVSEIINFAFMLRMATLWNVDAHSGGLCMWAGPVWVRPYILNYWPLEGYNQIMGHTPQADVWIVDEDEEGEVYNGFKHYYIDILGSLNAEPLILTI
jgi:hypothetical protein